MSDWNSDYRNEDPMRRDGLYDPNARPMNAAWGWIAAAVFIVLVLAVIFGAGHRPGETGTNVASNTMAPPAATQHVAPPTASPPPASTPAPSSAGTTPGPVTPAPSPAPAH